MQQWRGRAWWIMAVCVLFWIIIGVFTLLLVARLWAGPAPARKGDSPLVHADELPEEELWTPDALQKYGTPATAADLDEQGRADELRSLGYRGDIPDSD